jgi:uncharacterized protein YjdB/alpha-tubulin suppressor-like RCC1 family protein
MGSSLHRAEEVKMTNKYIALGLVFAALVLTSCKEENGGGGAPPRVATVVLDPDRLSLGVGEEVTVRAVVLDARGRELLDREVIWESLAPAVAEVDSTGRVVGRSAGSTMLRAAVEGIEGAAVVEVEPLPVVRIEVDPATATIQVDEVIRLTARAYARDGSLLTGRELYWWSSTSGIASVDPAEGVVTGHSPGSAEITATAEGVSATSVIEVAPPPVASLEISPPSLELRAGETSTLTAIPRSATGEALERAVAWRSIEPGVASVDEEGLVRANAPGATVLEASSEGVTVTVEVIVRAAALRVDPVAEPIYVGSTVHLEARIVDIDGNDLGAVAAEWTSDTPTVASVDEAGTVTAVAWGHATITARHDGLAADVAVRVLVEVARVQLAPTTAEILLGMEQEFVAVAVTPDGTEIHDLPVVWSVADGEVASVSSTGIATGLAQGTTTVRAEIEGVAGSADVSVVRLQFSKIFAGGHTACGLTSEGEAWCWGSDALGPNFGGGSPVPRRLPGSDRFVTLSIGWWSICGITGTGATLCRGLNDVGQLGNGTTTDSETFVSVAGGLEFAAVAVGTYHTCGITRGGAAYCWGLNDNGQLGTGDFVTSSIPRLVQGGLTFAQLAVTRDDDGTNSATCGVTMENKAYCWGAASGGILGNGLGTGTAVPVAVDGGHSFIGVDVDSDVWTPTPRPSEARAHGCGVTATGDAYCWGNSNALGDGSDGSFQPTPAPVAGTLSFDRIVVSENGASGLSCGIAGGVAYCWGGNVAGELGTGVRESSWVPVAVTTGPVVELAVGAQLACALGADELVRCWGYSNTGQVGFETPLGYSLAPGVVLGQQAP